MQTQFAEDLIEKRSIDYVPLAERHGKVWHLWPVWFSGDAHLATVATGVVGIALGGTLLDGDRRVLGARALGTFLHGLPFDPRAAARAAADDPVAAAIRICGRAAGMGRRADRLHRIQRVQSDSRGTDAACRSMASIPAPTMLIFALLSAVARGGRLRSDPHRATLACLCADRRAAGFLRRGARARRTSRAAVRAAAISRRALSSRNSSRPPPIRSSWSIYVSDYSRYLPRDVGVSASFWWTYLGAFIGGRGPCWSAPWPPRSIRSSEFAAALRSGGRRRDAGFGKPLLLARCSAL